MFVKLIIVPLAYVVPALVKLMNRLSIASEAASGLPVTAERIPAVVVNERIPVAPNVPTKTLRPEYSLFVIGVAPDAVASAIAACGN